MSDTTTATLTPSTPNDAIIRESLAPLPLYANATPEQRTDLEADCARCLADGISLEDYCSALAEWPDAGGYLSQAGDGPDADDSTPADQDAPAPTSTLAEANRTLARFGQACRTAADHNYATAELAFQFVTEFLGSAPGRAQRATAIEVLADEIRKHDEDSLSVPLAKAMARMKERANLLVRVHAVAVLLGDGRGMAKGDGTRKGRGKGGKDTRLPWGIIRECAPLVFREEDPHAEVWHVLPSIAAEARQLVAEIATSGMARQDVVAAVAKLMLVDARLELTAATESGDDNRVRAAESAVERWGGKVERIEGQDGKAKGGRKSATAKDASGPGDESQGNDGTPGQDDDAADADDEPAPQPPAESRQGTNLLAAARQGTAKDVAEMAVELVTGGDEPDDVLEHILRQLDGHRQLCGASHRAIKSALLVLERATRPPQRNPNANSATHAA